MPRPDVVYIVDNDSSIKHVLPHFFASEGLETRCFDSSESYLLERSETHSSCLIASLDLPHQGGLELQRTLSETRSSTPVIFLTQHGDLPTAVQAMKAGAVEVFTKPFDFARLLETVTSALIR